jgi:hypothetical protein
MVLSTNKFWAECICVNQHDVAERSARLRLMPEICKKAENTRIWLGDEDDKRADEIVSKMAEAGGVLMETVGHKWGEYENTIDIMIDLTAKSVARVRQGRPEVFTYDWSDFNELLSRSWWRRRQSIEETAWSKSNVLHFGQQNLALDRVLLDARNEWALFNDNIQRDRPGVDSYAGQRAALLLEYRAHALGAYNADKSLLHYGLLLKSTARGQFECSDPRDYIYRLNGVMAETMPDEPPPPADLSKPWPQVYKDFAAWALAREKDLLTLSLASEPAPELPSWVPNYRKCDEAGVLFRPSKPFLFAGKNGTVETAFSEDNNVMTVRGRLVDSIASYCPPLLQIPLPDPDKDGGLPVNRPTVDRVSSDPLDVEVSTSFAQRMVRMRRWLDACVAQAVRCHESQDSFLSMTEERFEQFWKTLTLSYITDESSTRTTEEYSTLFRGYLSFYKVGISDTVDISVFTDEESTEEFVEQGGAKDMTITENALYYAPTVQFAVTKEGRLALAPKRAEIGDVVCVLPGAQTAHVIRRQDNGRYRLVGDCYVHGLMDGEAMEMEDIPLENVELE